MRRWERFLIACALLALATPVQSEEARQTVEQLGTALQRNGNADHRLSKEQMAILTIDLRLAVFRLDTASVQSKIDGIETAQTSDEVRALCRSLLSEVKAERAARNNDFAQRIDLLREKARTACRDARAESELNPILSEFFTLAEELRAEPAEPKIQGLLGRLDLISQDVGGWQDLLAFQAAGYDKQAQHLNGGLASFVDGRKTFKGVSNVRGSVNADNSQDVTWENLPGSDEEIPLWTKDDHDHWQRLRTVPAGTTHYHFPPAESFYEVGVGGG